MQETHIRRVGASPAPRKGVAVIHQRAPRVGIEQRHVARVDNAGAPWRCYGIIKWLIGCGKEGREGRSIPSDPLDAPCRARFRPAV